MNFELNTQRLLLRPWQESDVEALYELAKDPEVGPACGWNPHKDRKESEYVLTKLLMNNYTWAIVLKETGEVIGDISLMPYGTATSAKNERQREIGFWLGRAYWGHGYMPEACLRLMEYAFEALDVECIWCGYHVDNSKSKRAQEKCGFRFSHVNEHHYNGQLDKYLDTVVNCMTKEEWSKR